MRSGPRSGLPMPRRRTCAAALRARGAPRCLQGSALLRGGRGRPEVRPPARRVALRLRLRRARPAGGTDAPAGLRKGRMEARGVEPLSRDVSVRTSTCVSGRFESRPRVPGRQGASRTSPERFWPPPYQAVNGGEPDLATDWEALPAGAIARGYLIKQPGRTELRQLKHGRLLTWPADQPRHAIRTSAIRSKPVRPRVRRTTEPPGPRRPHRPSAVSAARLHQCSKAAGL